MKSIASIIFFLFINVLLSQRPFITKWNTNANNDNSKQLVIGLRGDYNYSFFNFQDSVINGNGSGSGTLILDLPIKGIYIVSISPSNTLGFKASVNSNSDASKLIDVVQWGDIRWEMNLSEMFKDCKNISSFSASDTPNLSTVNNLSKMFMNASNFNQSIEFWNVSNVRNMRDMFNGASSFNQSLRYWNTINVTDMSSMFQKAISFNQPIGNWNTSNVIDMSGMFNGASSFNQPLFWNTNNVIDMSYMFNSALNFNQDLGNLSIFNLKRLAFMIDNIGLDCENYSLTLKKWALSNTPNNLRTRASNLLYNSEGKIYRDILINSKNWEIGGDFYDPSCSTTLKTKYPQSKLNIFPNPTKDEIFIETEKKIQAISIFSIDGKFISEVKEAKTVNFEIYPNSSYIIKILLSDGESFTKKIIKK